MGTFRVRSLRELHPLMRKHFRDRERRVKAAVRKTAQQGAAHVRRNVPVAFGELRSSVHAETEGRLSGHSRIIADAPHACAVEAGARPHWAPLEPLIRWVKLRGFQGLTAEPQRGRLPGTTTRSHAEGVAGQLAAFEQEDGSVDANAPEQIARAIQFAIAKRGTKPHWYARNALPAIEKILDAQIRAALPDK